jgi:chromosome segregation ATPase
MEQDARCLFLSTLVEGCRVLHMGPDDGSALLQLARGGASEVIGMTRFLPQAATLLDTYGISNVAVRPELPPPLEFPDDAFDFIICQDLWRRMQTHPRWKQELRRVLKSSGHLVTSACNEEGDALTDLGSVERDGTWSYGDCLEALEGQFGQAAVYGQIPVVASLLCSLDAGSDEPDLVLDHSLLEEDEENPGQYIMVFGPDLPERDQLLVVRHAFRDILEQLPLGQGDGGEYEQLALANKEHQAEVNQLTRDCDARISYLHKCQREQERVIEANRHRLDTAEEVTVQQKGQISELLSKCSTLRSLKNEYNAAREEMSTLRLSEEELQRNVSIQKDVLREQENSLQSYKLTALSAEESLSGLQQQKNVAQRRLDTALDNNQKLSVSLQSVQTELSTVVEGRDKIQNNHQELTSKNKNLDKTLHDLSLENQKLTTELEGVQKNAQKELDENKTITEALLAQSSQSTDERIEEAIRQSEQKTQAVTQELQARLDEKESTATGLGKLLSELREEAINKERQLEQSRQELTELQNVWEEKLNAAKERVATLLDDVESKVDHAQKSRETTEDSLKVLQMERDALQETLMHREKVLEQTEETLENIAEERDHMATRLQELTSELFLRRSEEKPVALDQNSKNQSLVDETPQAEDSDNTVISDSPFFTPPQDS